MARPLRLESEAGVYHVLNRGNYRAAIFQSDRTKAAFLKCLGEACGRDGEMGNLTIFSISSGFSV